MRHGSRLTAIEAMVLFEVSRERTANSKSKDLHREHRGKPEKNLRKIEALTAAAHLS
jgi:hypothetical protein